MERFDLELRLAGGLANFLKTTDDSCNQSCGNFLFIVLHELISVFFGYMPIVYCNRWLLFHLVADDAFCASTTKLEKLMH